MSRKWVNMYLENNSSNSDHYNSKLCPKSIILIVDTTYFSQFGLMVFRAANLKKNLLWFIVDHETNEKYREGIQFLIDQGWIIEMLIADGKPGLVKLFSNIPFQLCNFHIFQNVTRSTTKKPKLKAGIELRNIMFRLTETDEASFRFWIKEWGEKWRDFLKEKTINPITRKEYYTHPRLRKALRTIKSAMPYLFTYQELKLTKKYNTTNSLDGYFSHLKSKLSVHRGASKSTQIKIISKLIFR